MAAASREERVEEAAADAADDWSNEQRRAKQQQRTCVHWQFVTSRAAWVGGLRLTTGVRLAKWERRSWASGDCSRQQQLITTSHLHSDSAQRIQAANRAKKEERGT